MKTNKLKTLAIAICCLIAASWSEAQCMDLPVREDVPAGTVMAFAGYAAPHGWLLCDGQQYSNQKYPELYKVVQEKYVQRGSWVIEANKHSELEKYFCVPDLRGQVLNYIVSHGNVRNKQQDEEINQLHQTEREKAEKISFWSSGLDKDIQHLKDIESFDWKILEAIKIYYTNEAANKFNGVINIGFDKEELNDIYEIRLSELFILNTFIHSHCSHVSSYSPLLSGLGRSIPMGEMWSYCYANLCKFYLKSIINKKMDNYKKLKGIDHFLRGQI